MVELRDPSDCVNSSPGDNPTSVPDSGWPARGLPSAQLQMIAWLRWRIFANGLRRKGGAGELIGRILLFPMIAAVLLGPSIAGGWLAWYIASTGRWGYLHLVFWGAFAVAQLLNINLGEPGSTFDPRSLIRFPLSLPGYVLTRLGFGLLSTGNLAVSLVSLAIFVGVAAAVPGLWPWALASTAVFALANVLFSRMVVSGVDRWLSTRRARELFTGLLFAGSLVIQYINLNYNPAFHRRHLAGVHSVPHWATASLGHLQPLLRWLPPELAARAITSAQHGARLQPILALAFTLAYAACFLAVYSLRMRTEYRGENLSDAAIAVRAHPVHAPSATSPPQLLDEPPAAGERSVPHLPPTYLPLLGKEFLQLRRNVGLLYGVIAPAVMVFLFAGRISLRGGSHWLTLLAVGYALLGLAPMSYNCFGLEGSGAQFYFLSPVPLAQVFLAKNSLHFLLAAFDVLAILAVLGFVAGAPSATDVAFTTLWAAATLMLNATVGNRRSLTAPKKVNPGKTFNRAQSQLSAWLAIGIFTGCAALGAGIQWLAGWRHVPWLGAMLMAALAACSLLGYLRGLRSIDRFAAPHRDTLFEELGKKF